MQSIPRPAALQEEERTQSKQFLLRIIHHTIMVSSHNLRRPLVVSVSLFFAHILYMDECRCVCDRDRSTLALEGSDASAGLRS
jgi:hypothetical protein